MDETDYMIKLVNENNDMACIADYIMNITKNFFSFDDAKEIAIYLVKENKYSKEDIFRGLANNDILMIAKLKQMQGKSVQKKDEVRKSVPFKTKKKKVSPKVIASSLALIFCFSSVLYLNKSIQNYREDVQVSQLIGMAASNKTEKINIVQRNAYRIEANKVIVYDNGGIANDIIKICNKDPELLDLVLFRTYFDMSYNRLANMDEVIRILTSQAEHNENLAVISKSLDGCSSFLDYVFKKGYISANSDDYYLYQDAVNAYNNAKLESKYAYDRLPTDIQKRIEKLMSEYKKGKENLYSEYKDDLTELAEPKDGFNEGGRK